MLRVTYAYVSAVPWHSYARKYHGGGGEDGGKGGRGPGREGAPIGLQDVSTMAHKIM